jgi:uncharacterized membrane protein YidH (DUF202 family)
MEQLKPPRKALFVFVWGVLIWGGLTALAITFFDWYTTHQIAAPHKIVGRFVIFMAGGIVTGLLLWNRVEALDRKKLTRTGDIVRFVLFVSLMLGLVCVLWAMTRH